MNTVAAAAVATATTTAASTATAVPQKGGSALKVELTPFTSKKEDWLDWAKAHIQGQSRVLRGVRGRRVIRASIRGNQDWTPRFRSVRCKSTATFRQQAGKVCEDR